MNFFLCLSNRLQFMGGARNVDRYEMSTNIKISTGTIHQNIDGNNNNI